VEFLLTSRSNPALEKTTVLQIRVLPVLPAELALRNIHLITSQFIRPCFPFHSDTLQLGQCNALYGTELSLLKEHSDFKRCTDCELCSLPHPALV
jgi:hypothetical protein